MPDYIAQFVRRKPGIDRNGQVVKPELASLPPERAWTCAGSPPSLE
jgi:hypothetical protein